MFLINGGTSNGVGQIEFFDPWFPEMQGLGGAYQNLGMDATYQPHTVPYSIDENSAHLGIFLNEGLPYWQPPYYSVFAPQQDFEVNGKTITHGFESWNYNPNDIELHNPSNNPTAVVFKQPGATLTANMKGQRASDTPQATLANNGRKLSYDYVYSQPGFRPFLVYEDRGNIYSASQGEGGFWSNDSKIAAASGSIENLTPAVTYLNEMCLGYPQNQRLIAWTEHNTSTNSYMVRCNRSSFPLPVYEIPDVPYPSVAGYYLYTLEAESDPLLTGVVAFRGGSAFYSDDYTDGIRLWFLRNPVIENLNYEASATFPSVDNKKYVSSVYWQNPYYMLAWQQSNGIHYKEFSRYHDGDEDPHDVDYSTEVVLNSGYYYLLSNALPSLKSAGPYDGNSKNIVTVAWQATWRHLVGKYYVYTPVVCLREKTTTGNWLSLTMLQTGNTGNRNPVACGIGDMENRTLYVAYQETGGQVIYVFGYGEMWAYPSQPQISDGNNPAMNIIDDDIHLAWTEYHQTPYRIQTQVIAQGEENMMTAPHFRLLSFNLEKSLIGGSLINANADITLEMKKPTLITPLGVKTLDFQYTDTLVTPENVFEFEPVKVVAKNSRILLPFHLTVENLTRTTKAEEGLDIGIVDIAVRDAETKQVLKTVHSYNSTLLAASDTTDFGIADTFLVDLDEYVGKLVSLVVKAHVDVKTSADAIGIANVYDMRGSSHQEGEQITVIEESKEIPTQFRLWNNYPNPFNPSTTISFDLPEDVGVRIDIFDVSGRRIRTLLNEPKVAGTHQVLWNGNDNNGNLVASGLYVYRIHAGNYVQSKKMLFMK